MRSVEKKLSKSQIFTICLLIISILLTASYFVIDAIIQKRLEELLNSSSGSTSNIEILDGESIYLNQPVAYPTIEESEILFLEVENSDGRFGVSRYPDEQGSFIFHYYVDGKEQAIPYTPPITGAEGEFSYESLYAVETGDGYGMIYYLTYLCAALGAPYFTERIDLPSDETEEGARKRELLLKEYGISKTEGTVVSFEYGERDKTTGKIIEGSEDAHIIVIGKQPVSGTGYYFWVDGRDCVYYTTSQYFSYALVGFASFVKGQLVAAGLEGESVYGPYLTTDFKEWVTTVYDSESDRVFTNEDSGYGDYDNPNVVVKGDYYVSLNKALDFVPPDNTFTGYEVTEDTRFSFDLEALEAHPDFNRIKNTLKGKNVKSSAGLLTLLGDLYSSERYIEFGESDTAVYTYTVSKIESVITDTQEITTGTVAPEHNLLKVTYRYTVGGVSTKYDSHAVIDLNNLDPATVAMFVGLSIGESIPAVTFSVTYNRDNALSSNEKYVVTGITSIFNEYGAIVDKVTESTYVNISYYRSVDGVRGDTETTIIRLSDISDTDKLAPLKTLLLGKGKGDLSIVVYNTTYYYEYMRDFVTYNIEEIEYFVANRIIVSFAFCNASERDPFFGDTFFKNTLENSYKLYGLNAGSCETVVKLLGGIGTDSNSAVGLSGTTVAIGLTLENMEKYGLFAHKIYFEMPRGIYDASEGTASDSQDELSDYAWLDTLGFTLYISEAKYDENGVRIRYIGSDMYDVIASVPANDFDFLEYEFIDFWARKNLVMMDIIKLQGLRLEFNMEDLQGEYNFELSFKEAYLGTENGKYVIKYEPFEGATNVIKEHQSVKVQASEDAFDTAYKDMFGTGWGDLATLYNHTEGDGNLTFYPGSSATLGTAYFNSVYETLQLTRYLDTVDEELPAGAEPVFTMHLQVEGKEYYYTYEFYRIDDRRVVVSLFRSDRNGDPVDNLLQVSDYYISTFAFKKLVNSYIYLLNGKPVDESVSYD